MPALLLSLLLLGAAGAPEGATRAAEPQAPVAATEGEGAGDSATAAAAPAEAPAPRTAAAPLELPRSSFGFSSLVLPALLVAGAAIALVLARGRRNASQHVRVLETTPLGGKRSLVVARVGDEILVLASSEAGVSLLRTQPATGSGAETATPAAAARPAPAAPALRAVPPVPPEPPAPARSTGGAPREIPAALSGLAARLRAVRGGRDDAANATPSFQELLAESIEDRELHRKLARGEAGKVR